MIVKRVLEKFLFPMTYNLTSFLLIIIPTMSINFYLITSNFWQSFWTYLSTLQSDIIIMDVPWFIYLKSTLLKIGEYVHIMYRIRKPCCTELFETYWISNISLTYDLFNRLCTCELQLLVRVHRYILGKWGLIANFLWGAKICWQNC